MKKPIFSGYVATILGSNIQPDGHRIVTKEEKVLVRTLAKKLEDCRAKVDMVFLTSDEEKDVQIHPVQIFKATQKVVDKANKT